MLLITDVDFCSLSSTVNFNSSFSKYSFTLYSCFILLVFKFLLILYFFILPSSNNINKSSPYSSNFPTLLIVSEISEKIDIKY